MQDEVVDIDSGEFFEVEIVEDFDDAVGEEETGFGLVGAGVQASDDGGAVGVVDFLEGLAVERGDVVGRVDQTVEDAEKTVFVDEGDLLAVFGGTLEEFDLLHFGERDDVHVFFEVFALDDGEEQKVLTECEGLVQIEFYSFAGVTIGAIMRGLITFDTYL